MVKVPDHIDPLIESIDRALESEQKPYTSKNIGFGEIGHECSRYLFLKINSEEPEVFDAAALRRMSAGTLDEALMAQHIRKTGGVELLTNDPSRENKQFKLDFLSGRLTGRLDGVIIGLPQAPATWHVWEHKSCEDKKFDALIKLKAEKENPLLEWNHKYYAQNQTNMLGAELDRGYFTVGTPGLRRVTGFRTKLNREYAQSLVQKAEFIINTKEPPAKIGGPDWYQCKMCRFYNKCHG